jgi:hypothetical protein
MWLFDVGFWLLNVWLFDVATTAMIATATVGESWSSGCANECDAEQGRQNGFCGYHGEKSSVEVRTAAVGCEWYFRRRRPQNRLSALAVT